MEDILRSFGARLNDLALAWLTGGIARRRRAAAYAYLVLRNRWSIEPLLRLQCESDAGTRAVMCLALVAQDPPQTVKTLPSDVAELDSCNEVRRCAQEALVRLLSREK